MGVGFFYKGWGLKSQFKMRYHAEMLQQKRAGRVLQTSTQNSYLVLKKLLSSYKSNNVYSNSYSINTFDNFTKIKNMTSDDEYQQAKILIIGIGFVLSFFALIML